MAEPEATAKTEHHDQVMMDWYSPRGILFKRDEILWVLQYIELIETGIWPPDFKSTGYTGGKRGRRFGPAYFEVPVTISAEVKRRLDVTGGDGKILFWQVKAGITTFEDLELEAQCAVNFMSLWDFRKRPVYYTWRKNWRYYHTEAESEIKTKSLKSPKRKLRLKRRIPTIHRHKLDNT